MNNELQLLEYFDYAGKFDLDVRFIMPFPHKDIASLLDGKRKVLMASGPPAFDFEPATIGVADCVNDFVEFESEKTKQAWGQACDSSSSPSANLRFVPNGKPDSLNVTQGGEGGENVGTSSSGFDFGWGSGFKTCVSGHFIVTWLGLYGSKEVSDLSRFWNEYGNGMWVHRWTDNQWWLAPLAIFSSRAPSEDLFIEAGSQNYTASAESLFSEDFVFFQGPIFNVENGSTRQSRKERIAYVKLHFDEMLAEKEKEKHKIMVEKRQKQLRQQSSSTEVKPTRNRLAKNIHTKST